MFDCCYIPLRTAIPAIGRQGQRVLKPQGAAVYAIGLLCFVRRVMAWRTSIILSILALGLVLSGCTKCGPIWDDWQSPKSCKSDHL
jgi:hypothetical protein